MASPPERGPSLFDLVPMVKPLGGNPVVEAADTRERPEGPSDLPVEGRFHPPVNYVSDEEEV